MRKIHCNIEGCDHSSPINTKNPKSLPVGWGMLEWAGMEEGEENGAMRVSKTMVKAAAAQMPVAFEGGKGDELLEGMKPDPVPVLLFAHICPDHMGKIHVMNVEREQVSGYGPASLF